MYIDPAFPGGQHVLRRRRPGLGMVYQAPTGSPSILSDPRFSRTEVSRQYTDGGVIIQYAEPIGTTKAKEVPPPPPPPAPTYTPTEPPVTEPVTTQPQPTVLPSFGVEPGAWGEPAPPEPVQFAAPGDVSVSVTGPEGPSIEDEGHGFGMVEAALGAALAFLIGKAWQDRRR